MHSAFICGLTCNVRNSIKWNSGAFSPNGQGMGIA
jgi:hypothetical protein